VVTDAAVCGYNPRVALFVCLVHNVNLPVDHAHRAPAALVQRAVASAAALGSLDDQSDLSQPGLRVSLAASGRR
jgi:hypothetical protein